MKSSGSHCHEDQAQEEEGGWQRPSLGGARRRIDILQTRGEWYRLSFRKRRSLVDFGLVPVYKGTVDRPCLLLFVMNRFKNMLTA